MFWAAPAIAQCGSANTTAIHVAPSYLTQTPPAKGALTYTDPQYGCQIIRVTSGQTDYGPSVYAIGHEYIMSPINVNDTYIIVNIQDTSPSIVSIPTGTIVHPYTDVNLPNINQMPRWRHDDPDKFIYFGDGTGHGAVNQLMQYSVSGDSSTVLHTFTEYAAINFGGSHTSIASDVLTISMCGQLASGIWEAFAYDYVNGVKKTPAQLHGSNASGATVNTTANAGTGSISIAKAGGTGNWSCVQLQQSLCFFTVAGDATVYTISTASPIFTAGSNATVSVTPVFAQTETAGAAITFYFRTNDLRTIGDQWIQVTSSDNLFVQLYDINMNFISSVTAGIWAGATPHLDAGVDPVTGHPSAYVDAGNDISGPCSPTGVEKIDLIAGTRTCLLNGVAFGPAGHFSLTANGMWLFIHETDAVAASTTCLNADLPGNWTSLWGKFYNEMILIKTDGTAYYRQGYHYSRQFLPGCAGSYFYWWDPRVAISYSGKYAVFDSNFNQNPAVTAGNNFNDVFLLSTQIPGTSGSSFTSGNKVTSGVSIR